MALRLFSLALACVCLVTSFASADPLPGTQPLTLQDPLDVAMVAGIDKFALRELSESVGRRAKLWNRDYSGILAYLKSVEPNREHLKTIIGAVDPRQPADTEGHGIELIASLFQTAEIAKGDTYSIYSVRWQVLDGVTAEGLLLEPKDQAIARVVAIPDADWTPEMIAGIAPGVDPASQFARRLAEQGCQVLVPTLIDRDDTFSGNPEIRMTNQAHREWIYRQAFEMGRHVIGYEVQKVLAAVDQFTAINTARKMQLRIGVVGAGEGGLVALYSAAVDRRIDAAMVSGYFQPREAVWQEPIYRNVWALLHEFGDAELASLVAPRPLIIEAAGTPEIVEPRPIKQGRSGGAAPGKITVPVLAEVKKEIDRAKPFYNQLKVGDQLQLITSGDDGRGAAGSDAALAALLKGLDRPQPLKPSVPLLKDNRTEFAPIERQARQVRELMDFTQRLVRRSEKERDKLWSKVDRTNTASWEKTSGVMRDLVYDEMIGRLPDAVVEPNVRTRQVLDEADFRGYEVTIDVYPDVFAGGILLLPKDLQQGEKRPVVVCQHGLEGVPMDTISKTATGFQYYKAFTAELASKGFITYAPQNPYRGKDLFRTLQRKSNPMKRSLFSYIIRQHQRTLEFLASLPNVDKTRIGFYGLSYGGKTAVRVPPMLSGYALSICSADYNEWVKKNTSVDERYSYMFTGEYEIFEWNMGHFANYAELSNLMTPRPFMVERGHTDGVAPDEWVAYEYAKVKRHYDFLGLGEKTEMEVFNGPHTINGQGTYLFLQKHLNWKK